MNKTYICPIMSYHGEGVRACETDPDTPCRLWDAASNRCGLSLASVAVEVAEHTDALETASDRLAAELAALTKSIYSI